MLVLVYNKLEKAVGRIECFVQDTMSRSRHLYSRVYEGIEDMQELREIKFFVKVLFAVHY